MNYESFKKEVSFEIATICANLHCHGKGLKSLQIMHAYIIGEHGDSQVSV